jgi:hypothetical protein
MTGRYVLRGHEAVATDDSREWARMFDKTDARRVAKDTIGEAEVSTVFLGIDHNWGGGPPLLFETMVFGDSPYELQWRYSTWEEAEAGHARVVAALREGREPDAG